MRGRFLLLALLIWSTPTWAQPRGSPTQPHAGPTQPHSWPTQPPQVEQRRTPKSAWQRLMNLLFHLFGGDRPQWRGPFGDDCLEPACRGLPRDRGPQPSRD